MESFVEVDWLRDHLRDERLRIVDTRSAPHGAPGQPSVTGADQFAAGHIPGAIHLDYADDLSDPETPYATRVAPGDVFARVLGEHGIANQHSIIAYDDGTTPYAARFLWMCRYYGHDGVRILAGGFPAWRAAGGPITSEATSYPRARFTPRVREHLRASRDEVLAVATGGSDAQLLETQRDSTYASRDRDIAGARRLSASRLLEDHRGGRIANSDTIDRLIADAGIDRSKRTITSCGSGVGAAGAYLALVENGFSDVAVYDGSWLDWSHHGLPTVPKRVSS